MKIAILDKETLAIQSWYDADQPSQSRYGGPWGNPQVTVHIGIDSDMDHRAVSFEMDAGQIVAIEDENLKEQFATQDQLEVVKAAIARAMAFGQGLVTEFAAENVMLGITQDGKTGEVLNKMAPVMTAVQSGSLYEAIARAKAITPDQYDSKYLEPTRMSSSAIL